MLCDVKWKWREGKEEWSREELTESRVLETHTSCLLGGWQWPPGFPSAQSKQLMHVHLLPRVLLQSLGALHLAYRLLYLDLRRTLLGLGARWKSEYKGGVPTLSPVFKSTSLLHLTSVSPSKASVGILTPWKLLLAWGTDEGCAGFLTVVKSKVGKPSQNEPTVSTYEQWALKIQIQHFNVNKTTDTPRK